MYQLNPGGACRLRICSDRGASRGLILDSFVSLDVIRTAVIFLSP